MYRVADSEGRIVKNKNQQVLCVFPLASVRPNSLQAESFVRSLYAELEEHDKVDARITTICSYASPQ